MESTQYSDNKHAFLSPSNYSWMNYSIDRLVEVYKAKKAIEFGTKMHAIAKDLIDNNIKLPRVKHTLNMYVNDAIGFLMKTEQRLFYSDFCYGTADAILFENKLLRIHDLKTGKQPASFKQLYGYAALYCLQNKVEPSTIDMELRIYQSNEIAIDKPDPEDVRKIMDTIVTFDKVLTKLESEA